MKKLFNLAILLVTATCLNATNYYFSSLTGDDARTTAQAQNAATPWKTITKLNAMSSTLVAGDTVFFCNGSTFYGALKIQKSGTISKPIVYASYGDKTKATPVISGLATITTWVNKGNGIWEGDCPSCGASLNTFLINGAVKAMGRYPNSNTTNKGYLNFEAHSSNTQITDKELTSTPNWSGAELVMRPNRWVIDRNKIGTHSGSVINYTSKSGYVPIDGFGYFIQNHLSTLDQFGEWYYNASTKKVSVYFGTAAPSAYNVQASNTETFIDIKGLSNIVIRQLKFTGSNDDAVRMDNVSNITLLWTSFLNSGSSAIVATNASGVKVTGARIVNTNNCALAFSASCNGSELAYNDILNTGLIAGMGESGTNTGNGILINGDNNVVKYNNIDSTGYIGIFFQGTNVTINNNYINHFTMSKDDGAGIYTWAGADNKIGYSNRKIISNIILNGIGAGAGTNAPSIYAAEGIYMDDNSAKVEILNNTIANCASRGIYLHNSFSITVRGNTVYNNNTQLTIEHDANCTNCVIKDNRVSNNILFSKDINDYVLYNNSLKNDLLTFGTYDSNYYCRPFDDKLTISTTHIDSGNSIFQLYDLQKWQSIYTKDVASRKSPVALPYYTINSFVGQTKFSNGSFSANVKGLTAYSSNGNINTAWDNTGKLDGGSLKCSNLSSKQAVSIVQLNIGAVTAGKKYILKFSLLGEKANQLMNLYLMQEASPYKILTSRSYCKINNTRTENEFLFTATTTDSNADIVFEIGSEIANFWLDNVQLYEATVTMSVPDDHILFENNPTTSPKTVTLNAIYKDVKNVQYSGNVTLAPYTSIILMKVGNVITGFQHPVENEQASMELFPNPASDWITVRLPENEEQEGIVEIFDLAGRLVYSQQQSLISPTHTIQLSIQDFQNGTYIVRVNTANKVFQSKFIKQS